MRIRILSLSRLFGIQLLGQAISALVLVGVGSVEVLHADEVIFPHVVTGADYATELVLANQENAPSVVGLSFFTPSGEATDVFLDSKAIQIAGRSSVRLQLKPTSAIQTGWARARSAVTITATLRISYRSASGGHSTLSFADLRLFRAARIDRPDQNPSGRTALAVCNPASAPLSLDLEVRGAGAETVGKVSWSLSPREQRALYLDELNIAGAQSVEIVSRSGLFSALSIFERAGEIATNSISEVLDRRFALRSERIDVDFSPYRVRTHGNLAVVVGNNGLNFFDLARKTRLGAIALQLREFWENSAEIAFHPSKPIMAVAGQSEGLLVDWTTRTVLLRLTLFDGGVAFDNLTESFIASQQVYGFPFSQTLIVVSDQNFQPVARKEVSYAGPTPQARDGVLVVPGYSSFYEFRLPSLEMSQRTLPAGGTTNYPVFSGDGILVFGPDQLYSMPAEHLVTLYYPGSGRMESFSVGLPLAAKAVHADRLYLSGPLDRAPSKFNQLKVINLVERRTVYAAELEFSAKSMDFWAEGNALVAVDRNAPALWIVRLLAQ